MRWWFACLACLACQEPDLPKPVVVDCNRPSGVVPLQDLRYVAHAGGSPQGLEPYEVYTNSREAFEISYRNGFRAFEFDFVRLGDGTVIAAHDAYEPRYGLDMAFADATRGDVEGRKLDGRYPLLFASDIIELMADYPDVWVIIDSKWEHAEVARTFVNLTSDESILDRLVPHLASSEHVAELEALYPFPQRMVALYRWPLGDEAIVETMQARGLDSVMMWWNQRWTPRAQRLLDDADIHVWVHTPAQIAVIDDFLSRGVRVYTDGYIQCPAAADGP